jgi:hypothetical protein
MPVINDRAIKHSTPRFEDLVSLPCSRQVTTRVRDLLPEVLADVNNAGLIAPQICYEVVAVERKTPGQIVLVGGATLIAPLLAHRLARASHILFGTATIGTAMAREVRRCFKAGQNLKAVLMEEVANVALFETANGLQAVAEEQASRLGLSTSGPLSPGDHDGFGLDQQPNVIALAGADKLGITLTRTGQMDPIHSGSVVIGLGKNMRKWTRIDDCKTCRSREKCSHYLRSLETAA